MDSEGVFPNALGKMMYNVCFPQLPEHFCFDGQWCTGAEAFSIMLYRSATGCRWDLKPGYKIEIGKGSRKISKILVFFFYLSQSKKVDDDENHYTNLNICYLLFKYLFVLQILEFRKR